MNIYLNTQTILFAITGAILLSSCKKDNNGGAPPAPQKPKVGTTWTYRYYTFYENGGLATTGTITYKAKIEETIGGENWLRINDLGPDTTVYLMKEKAGGLYQYTNNNSYLLCKNPASLNETYNTFNKGSAEDFQVLGVNFTLPTDIGDVVANYYEGTKNGNLIDQIWYNANAWIVRHQVFRKFPMGTVYYKYSAMFLQQIIY